VLPAKSAQSYWKSFFEPPNVIATFLAISTVALVIVTRDLVNDARDTAHRQLRAYLGAGKTAILEITADRQDTPDIYANYSRAMIALENSGLTPAREVRAVTFHHFIGFESMKTDPWDNVTRLEHDFGSIDPRQALDMVLFFEDNPLNYKHMTEIFHIKTCVTYRDIFGTRYLRTFTHYLNQAFTDRKPIILHPSPRGSAERVSENEECTSKS
jgi:hypothetical protein